MPDAERKPLSEEEMVEILEDIAPDGRGCRRRYGGLLRHIGRPRLGARQPAERLLRVGSESELSPSRNERKSSGASVSR
jgi:hypothetical protein